MGCGTGENLVFLNSVGSRVAVGVDIASKAVAFANATFRKNEQARLAKKRAWKPAKAARKKSLRGSNSDISDGAFIDGRGVSIDSRASSFTGTTFSRSLSSPGSASPRGGVPGLALALCADLIDPRGPSAPLAAVGAALSAKSDLGSTGGTGESTEDLAAAVRGSFDFVLDSQTFHCFAGGPNEQAIAKVHSS